jgi:hypothetical protein
VYYLELALAGVSRARTGLQMTVLGDRFKVFQGGSRHLEEEVRFAEELAVLQGKRQ